MNIRSISAIILAIIVVIEIVVFITNPTPTMSVSTGKSGFFAGSTTIVDNEARQDRNQKFITIIAATVLIGGIVTFALPNKKKDGD